MLGYKIVEVKGADYLTLFHGINGSRVLPLNTWIRAEIKEDVQDGRGRPYLSGLHFLPNLETAERYFSNFRKKENRIIIECEFRGNIHKKRYDDSTDVFLADEMFISENSSVR